MEKNIRGQPADRGSPGIAVKTERVRTADAYTTPTVRETSLTSASVTWPWNSVRRWHSRHHTAA